MDAGRVATPSVQVAPVEEESLCAECLSEKAGGVAGKNEESKPPSPPQTSEAFVAAPKAPQTKTDFVKVNEMLRAAFAV